MSDDNKETQVLVTEKTYEVDKKDFLHIQDVKSTWYNTTAGFMDTLRLIPRLLMVCQIQLMHRPHLYLQ